MGTDRPRLAQCLPKSIRRFHPEQTRAEIIIKPDCIKKKRRSGCLKIGRKENKIHTHTNSPFSARKVAQFGKPQQSNPESLGRGCGCGAVTQPSTPVSEALRGMSAPYINKTPGDVRRDWFGKHHHSPARNLSPVFALFLVYTPCAILTQLDSWVRLEVPHSSRYRFLSFLLFSRGCACVRV